MPLFTSGDHTLAERVDEALELRLSLMLLDTSGLLAALDAGQRLHGPCAAALKDARGPLWLAPFVLAELDYLLFTRVGRHAQLAWLGEVARGACRLEPFGADDVAAAVPSSSVTPIRGFRPARTIASRHDRRPPRITDDGP